MSWGGEDVADAKGSTQVSELRIVELGPMVGDECVRDAEMIDDVLFYELCGVALGDLQKGLGLHPLYIVDGDLQI